MKHDTIHRNWNNVYADKATPWDMGKPEPELVKLVEKGVIQPCKALNLDADRVTMQSILHSRVLM